jgi:hypothetical protein
METARYLAFILLGTEPNSVQMIDLGLAEPINQLISAFRHRGFPRSDGAARSASLHQLEGGLWERSSLFPFFDLPLFSLLF